jgi:hypothetical protein
MKTIEYNTVDKSGWGSGPWQDEPDKKQWLDLETRLPCLAVRGPGGHWCGYVGVTESHPLHGKDYNDCVVPELHESHEGDENDWHYSCTPGGMLDCHGGVTFANECSKMNEERWRNMQAQIARHEDTAAKHPHGDSAKWLAVWRPVLNNFQLWREQCEATSICHKPGEGEPGNIWWFGFDCAHSGDFCPAYESVRRHQLDEDYRTIEYVKEQCSGLAKQILELDG